MRMVLTWLVATVLAAAAVAHADAASPKKKRLQAGPPGKPYDTGGLGRRNGQSDYHENVLERVPFGSHRWWEVYGRQHGGPQG